MQHKRANDFAAMTSEMVVVSRGIFSTGLLHASCFCRRNDCMKHCYIRVYNFLRCVSICGIGCCKCICVYCVFTHIVQQGK